MIIEGEKWACESCVRGHRVSNCTHAGERYFRIYKPNQPPPPQFLGCCPALPQIHARPCECRNAVICQENRQYDESTLLCIVMPLTRLLSRSSSTAHQQEGPPRLSMSTLSVNAPFQVGSRQVRLRREDQQVCAPAAHCSGSPRQLLLQPWRTLHLFSQERAAPARHRARVRFGPGDLQRQAVEACSEASIASEHSELGRHAAL